VKIENSPKVLFSGGSFERMMEYARAADGEVAGFATVEERGSGLYEVTESYIMPQMASGGGVLINADTVQDFMAWCNQNGRPDRPAKARLWWHSHAGFSTFRSMTDKGTVALLRQVMPYLICMVVNKAREYELSFYQGDFIMTGLRAYRVSPQLQMRSEVEAEVREMVTPWHTPISEHAASRTESRSVLPYSIHDDFDMAMEHKPLSEKSFHEMTETELEEYAKQYELPLIDGMAKTKEIGPDDDTKRFIVEEGITRPE
jgi:hypothetical protein